jgi:hypothetical protein
VHWSLFCDESLAGFDALSVVEPYIYEDVDTGEPAFPVERNWQLFKPSTKQEGEARYTYRASVWVNKRHAAQQVAVPFSDVVAVTIPTNHGSTLIVSAYDVKSTAVKRQAKSSSDLSLFVCLFVLIYQAICGIRMSRPWPLPCYFSTRSVTPTCTFLSPVLIPTFQVV